jgi:hypothetical protein
MDSTASLEYYGRIANATHDAALAWKLGAIGGVEAVAGVGLVTAGEMVAAYLRESAQMAAREAAGSRLAAETPVVGWCAPRLP